MTSKGFSEGGSESLEISPGQKQQLVIQLGGALHDEWRAPREIDLAQLERSHQADAEDARATHMGSRVFGSKQETNRKAGGSYEQLTYLRSLGAEKVYEPRMKTTKDKAWISLHDSSEVDIANTSFEDLPEDWQAENKIAAEVAMKEVFEAISRGDLLDKAFIERASSAVHDSWLERNGSWAPPEQNKTYLELSEEEQDKDRAQIRKAIELYQAI